MYNVKKINFVIPFVKVKEDDYDKDGKKDKLYFEAESLLSATENIYSVTVLLLFNYKLYVSIRN